jgi:tetratricopeptide (TPR) repeat protein
MQITRKLITLLMLLIYAGGCNQKSTDVELPLSSNNEEALKHYSDAQYWWAQGEGNRGRESMEKALGADPNFILANLYVPTGDPNKWKEYRDRAKQNGNNGNDYEKLSIKMWEANREGRSMDVIGLCKELVSKYPNSSGAYVELGNAYTSIEDFDNAIDNYNKALKINPKSYLAWRGLASHQITFGGNSLLPKDKQSKSLALKYTKGMVRSRPNAPFSYQAQGNVERQYGNMKNAGKHYKKMIEVAEETNATTLGNGYNLLAHTYLFSNDYDNARKNYQLAYEKAPFDVSKYGFGEFGLWSYLFEQDYEGALIAADELEIKLSDLDLSKAQMLDRKANLQFNRFLAYAHNKNKSSAYSAMKANWKIRSDRMGISKTKDEVAQGNYIIFNTWMESWYYILFNDNDKAKKSLDKLYGMVKNFQDPGTLDGYNGLSGMMNYLSGNYDKALDHFKSIEKENNLYFSYWKALTYEATGENNKAQEIFEFLANWNFQGWEPALVRSLAKNKLS